VTPGLQGHRPEKDRVSLSQRVDGQRRGQGLALSRCRRPPTTEVRVTACHHALYFVRRGPRFCRRRSALASRTSSRRDKAPGGSPIRADFLNGAPAGFGLRAVAPAGLRGATRTGPSSLAGETKGEKSDARNL
jgi:hypothetical protein